MRFHVTLALTAALAVASVVPASAGTPVMSDGDSYVEEAVAGSSLGGAGIALAVGALVVLGVAAGSSSSTTTTPTGS